MSITGISKGNDLHAKSVGSSSFPLPGVSTPVQMNNVLHIPDLPCRLLSVKAATKYDVEFTFFKTRPNGVSGHIRFPGVSQPAPMYLVQNHYVLCLPARQTALFNEPLSPPAVSTAKQNERLPFSSYRHTLLLEHLRLCHASERLVRNTVAHTHGGLDILSREHLDPCSACVAGKSHHTNTPATRAVPSERDPALRLVHTDWWGPYRTPGPNGERYIQVFIDDMSGYAGVYPSRNKDCGADNLRHFAAMLKEITNNKCSVHLVQADYERVYTHGAFAALCSNVGYLQRFSSPYSHNQNGRAERYWRTMENFVSAMFSYSGVGLRFWPYAVRTFTIHHNMMASTTNSLSPYERLTGKRPDISALRTWGCPVEAYVEAHDRPKFGAKCQQGINLGPCVQTKGGFYVYFPKTHSIRVTRHIPTFDELWRARKEFYNPLPPPPGVVFNTPPAVSTADAAPLLRLPMGPPPLPHPPAPAQAPNAGLPPPLQTPLQPAQPPLAPRLPIARATPITPAGNTGAAPLRLLQPRPLGFPPGIAAAAPPAAAAATTAAPFGTPGAGPSVLPDGPNTNNVPGHPDGSRRVAITPANDVCEPLEIISRGKTRNTRDHFFTKYANSYNITREAIKARAQLEPTPCVPAKPPTASVFNDSNFDVEWAPIPKKRAQLSHFNGRPLDVLRDFLHAEKQQGDISPPSTGQFFTAISGVFSPKNNSAFFHASPIAIAPALSTAATRDFSKIHDIAIDDCLTTDNPVAYCFVTISLPSGATPKTYHQAINSVDRRHWIFALDSEYDQLVDAGTWTLVKKSEARNVITGKWVFKIKRKADGSIERYKARWVARGFAQRQGIDYFENFSPTIRYSSIRLLLSLANALDMGLYGCDVSNAFARAQMDTDQVHVFQPTGYEKTAADGSKLVTKLKMSLYGTKQAARLWNIKFREHLLDAGWRQFESDTCIFTRTTDRNGIEYIGIYVDDIVHLCRDKHVHATFHAFCNEHFPTTTQGELTWILGMEVRRNRRTRTLTINQTQKILELLEHCDMLDAKPLTTPMEIQWKKGTGSPTVDPVRITEYRSKVASCSFIAGCTRPDIQLAVSKLSRHLSRPNEKCFTALTHLLRYLAGTPELGIRYHFGNETTLTLETYADSTFGGEHEDKAKSQGGYTVHFGGGPIDWSSKLQSVIALSSAEAEQMSAFNTSRTIVHFRQLLGELGHADNQPTIIREDNTACIAQSKNPVDPTRTRHVLIQYHYLRELTAMGIVRLIYICTRDQVADILTKPLPPKDFLRLRPFIVSDTDV